MLHDLPGDREASATQGRHAPVQGSDLIEHPIRIIRVFRGSIRVAERGGLLTAGEGLADDVFYGDIVVGLVEHVLHHLARVVLFVAE